MRESSLNIDTRLEWKRVEDYLQSSSLISTDYLPFSPCNMCTGAILLYKIPRVVIGENATFKGGEDLLKAHSVDVVVLDNEECKDLMAKFIRAKPEVWYKLFLKEDCND